MQSGKWRLFCLDLNVLSFLWPPSSHQKQMNSYPYHKNDPFVFSEYHCFGSIPSSEVGGAGNGVILADRSPVELPYTKIYLMVSILQRLPFRGSWRC